MKTSTTLKNAFVLQVTLTISQKKITSEVKFTERKSALQKNNEVRKKILPFVTTYHPALQNLKNILMSKWHLIQDQPLLREIYIEPSIILYKRGKTAGRYPP